jgi:hypothetical protein
MSKKNKEEAEQKSSNYSSLTRIEKLNNQFFSFLLPKGPRVKKKKTPSETSVKDDEKRPRTAFSGAQLARLKVMHTLISYLLRAHSLSRISLLSPLSH